MFTLITVMHCITCVFLILLVLVQSGKGAEISASFGGSSQTVFGASGGANFLQKFTAGAAAFFFITSLMLTMMSTPKGIMDQEPLPVPAQQTAPEAPAAPAEAPKN